MSKQMSVVGGQQRSIFGRLISLVVFAALVWWFIKEPVTAATTVKHVWIWFGSAVTAIVSFLQSLFG